MGLRRAHTEHELRDAVLGQLYFGPTPLDDYGPRMQARLLNRAGEDLILPLQFAKIARLEGVMHITGIEYHLRGRKGSPTRWKQSWLCAQRPEDATPFLAKVRVPNVTGFENEDDEWIAPLDMLNSAALP